MNKKDKIIIVGAGLCGSLLAIRLAQRGYKISLYEKQPDMRKIYAKAGRSINLALSDRGLKALERVGLKNKVLEKTIPMRGRLIHPLGEAQFLSPYSGRPTDYINSVSRSGLNIILLDEIDKLNNINVIFNAPVTYVNVKEAEIKYQSNNEEKVDRGTVVIGTDGGGSVVRRSMMPHSGELLFNYSQNFLRHGYKELSIHPDTNSKWKIEKEALHIWPRGAFMIIALPNLDGSFTLTMFHPYGTDIGLRSLDTEAKIQSFFEEYYPTLLPHIPHYKKEFFANPVGTLGTIKCYPWQAFGKTLIMGDASHAVVPFYGQGMNASLEDVRVFDELIEEYGSNWKALFVAFQNRRKENTDAIADLAIDNFYEMRDHVDDVAFIRKRKIEMQLEQEFSDYYSKYSLVTFQANLTYREAMIKGRKQDDILLNLCKNDDFEKMPLEHFYTKVKAK
ncbi:MAG: NAD(P)/FAD-dependent oxidoreductase [Saprospiraceae bacterium]